MGSQTQEKPIVVADVPRCPSCGSTERTAYSNRVRKELSGQTRWTAKPSVT